MDSNYFFRHAIHKYDYRNKSMQVLEDISMNSRDPLSAFYLYSISSSQYIFHEIFIPIMQACRPWVPRHTQILADQLTLFQPGGTDYAHLIATGTPGFSDLPKALQCRNPIILLTLLHTTKKIFMKE